MWSFRIAHKAFAHLPLIEDFALTLDEGSILALVGPSGAGKTSLLNIMAGLDTNFEGKVRSTLSAPRIAMMFQEARLMPWLNVIDNVLVGSKAINPQQQEQAQALVATLGLSGYEKSFPSQLSGGMQKRVALARAFIHEPHLLLMDEPFSSLDVTAADDMRFHLLRLKQRFSTSIIYVTHDIREALCVADRLLLLAQAPLRIVNDIHNPLPRPLTLFDERVTQQSTRIQHAYTRALGHQHALLSC